MFCRRIPREDVSWEYRLSVNCGDYGRRIPREDVSWEF